MLRRISGLKSGPTLGRDSHIELACEAYLLSPAAQLVHLCRNAAIPDEWSAEQQYDRLVSDGFAGMQYDRTFEPVRYREKRKDGGGTRFICEPPADLKMWHHLGLDLLQAQQTPPDFICDWRGRGTTYAVHRLVAAFRSPEQYVVLADVTKCFDNVKVEAVAELGLLPSEFFRSVVLPPNGFTFRRHDARSPLRVPYGQTHNEVVPTGLLQGSPISNALFALSVSDLPLGDDPSLALSLYADNVGVVTSSLEDARRAEDALSCYFSSCRVGPLSLQTEIRRAGDGFDFLGYEISVLSDGEPFVDLTDKNWMKLIRRADLSSETFDEVDKALAALVSFSRLSVSARERLEDILVDGIANASPLDDPLPDHIMRSALRPAIDRRVESLVRKAG